MHEWFNLLKHPFRAQYNVRTDSCKQSSRSYADMIRFNVVLKIKLLAQPVTRVGFRLRSVFEPLPDRMARLKPPINCPEPPSGRFRASSTLSQRSFLIVFKPPQTVCEASARPFLNLPQTFAKRFRLSQCTSASPRPLASAFCKPLPDRFYPLPDRPFLSVFHPLLYVFSPLGFGAFSNRFFFNPVQ